MTGGRRVFAPLAVLLFVLMFAGCPFKDNPPATPVVPTGPTEVHRESSYTYYATTIDPDGDSLYIEFSHNTGSYEYSSWSELLASGGTANEQINWWYGGSNNTLRVRAMDAHGLYSDWSPELSVTVYETTGIRTGAVARASTFAAQDHSDKEPK